MAKSKNVFNGVLWSAVERFSVQGIQFIVSVILARILTPSDFGVIALITVFMIIFQSINESGLGIALMHKLDRDELDYSSVFFANIALGIFLYLIIFFLALPISWFFNQPELVFCTRLLGINIILSSFNVVQVARFIIAVNFKTQAKASFMAVILSGLGGIIAAYQGLGVFALILQSLTYNLFNTIFIWYFAKWTPILKFSFVRFKLLFKYAYKLISARLINVIFQNIYSVVIGKFFTVELLGYFNRAKSFETISSNNITSIVQRVSTPLLCQYQNDYDKMKAVLLKFILSTAFFVYPLLFGLIVLSDVLIEVLLTDKWMPAAGMLRILCPVGMCYVISTFNRNIFNATGRTDWALSSEMLKKIIFTFILFLSIYWGFTAVLISQVIMAIIELLIDTYYSKRQIGITLWEQLSTLKGVLGGSLFMALIIILITNFIESSLSKLIIGFISGSFTYFFICYWFNIAEFRNRINNFLLKK